MRPGIATLGLVDDSRGSRVAQIRGAPNEGTLLRASEDDPRLPPNAIPQAWSSLVPGLALIPARDPSAIGYRLFWTGCGETGFRDFACVRDAHLIIGRHAACDVVLGADAELSLRHLIVLPARATGGEGPALRLVDLHAALPMLLDDDSQQRSLRAEGPFAVRVGRYVLGGFPIGPGQPAPPEDLPRAERVDASSPGSERSSAGGLAEIPSAEGGPYRSSVARPKSVITMLPRPIILIESVGTSTIDAIGLLGAARDGERVRIPVRQRDLDCGVLVGRADKCTDRGLRPLLTIRVSRLHAVVIHVEGRVMLYDCASTNGTFVAGRRIRSLELVPDGPVVQLAGGEGIELRWTALTR